MTRPLAIEAVGIHKAFGSTRAVDGASLTVESGTLVALLGPSGSGKTTMLRAIAGFEVPDSGTVAIGGREVAGPGAWVEPEHRRIGMVFQEGALFPHLTVARNVAFGGADDARVDECLALVGLGDRRASYPHELSGGERQRVALARALAPEPDVLLLDEPFGALDAQTKTAMHEFLHEVRQRTGCTVLMVTHDVAEAVYLSDRTYVLSARPGRVAEEVVVPFGGARGPEVKRDARFLDLHDELTEMLKPDRRRETVP